MEAATFRECFGDDQAASGDGYMHTVVQPQMNLLGVIEMDAMDGIANLMQHQK